MKTKRKGKKLLLAVIALVLVAAIGAGIWFFSQGSAEPVNVFSFEYLGMTEYWGDMQNSYGPVSTDKIQTVYLTETQTVTEILVAQGDTVKKGDLLMTFDTTLSDIAVERKRLDVEKLKLQLSDAEKELQRIRGMRPMSVPTPSPDDGEADENLGEQLKEPYRISTQVEYDGSAPDKALICWVSSAAYIDEAMMEALRQQAEKFQNENALNAPVEPEVPDPTGEYLADPTEGEAPSEGESETPEPIVVSEFYVVFKVTKGNMSLGSRLTWQGMKIAGIGGNFGFKFFDAYSLPDYTMTEEDTGEDGDSGFDLGSGFTSAQLAQMRAEQEKKIQDIEFQIKIAEADYKIMLTEASDGNVYAQIDGEVVSVLDPEEAMNTMQPVLKVSGGGGFYIQGTISELEAAKLQIGQEVTVNDYRSGMIYTGYVESKGDFPASNGYWNGMGNPNTTYYPFTVFVDGSADLQQGRYVDLTYSTSGETNGIYLENPFIRTEQGKSYVMVLGADGKLEKRFVTTGKSLYGSYTEIISGITPEDWLAFPYGKDVKDGAPAVKADIQELFNY